MNNNIDCNRVRLHNAGIATGVNFIPLRSFWVRSAVRFGFWLSYKLRTHWPFISHRLASLSADVVVCNIIRLIFFYFLFCGWSFFRNLPLNQFLKVLRTRTNNNTQMFGERLDSRCQTSLFDPKNNTYGDNLCICFAVAAAHLKSETSGLRCVLNSRRAFVFN